MHLKHLQQAVVAAITLPGIYIIVIQSTRMFCNAKCEKGLSRLYQFKGKSKKLHKSPCAGESAPHPFGCLSLLMFGNIHVLVCQQHIQGFASFCYFVNKRHEKHTVFAFRKAVAFSMSGDSQWDFWMPDNLMRPRIYKLDDTDILKGHWWLSGRCSVCHAEGLD